MKKLLCQMFLFILLSACLTAQDADSIHAISDKKPFPISAKKYNEITGFKVAYFTSYHYNSNWVFSSSVNVTGVLYNGKYFETSLELYLDDQNVFRFTGNSESCVSLRKPAAAFDDFGCVKGGDYYATLTDSK
jgi:hypothetical protein